MVDIPPHIARRVWSQTIVRSPDECWPWNGNVLAGDYGAVKAWGKIRRADRVVWTIVHGPLPPEMTVWHECGRNRCCNPDHLRTSVRAN